MREPYDPSDFNEGRFDGKRMTDLSPSGFPIVRPGPVARDYLNDDYPTPRTLSPDTRSTRMPSNVHWFIDKRKNTAHVRSVGTDPETFTISVDTPGQRSNTCTVPASFFREVADMIDTPIDPPDAA
ncbi:MAG: hypothetical protein H0X39_00185 [Actinobacteria bacterium]|nr:hypothetical protein [Actinomycetota bacterium]